MVILNKFTHDQIPIVADQICFLIRQEKNLTNRSKTWIEKLLKKQLFYVAVEGNLMVCGFIAKEALINNYYELKCWYVVPNLRNTGLAQKIFAKAIIGNQQKLFCVTFLPVVVKKVEYFNFKQIALFELPPAVIISYLLTRQRKSVIRHLFYQKSYLLIKT